MASSVKPNKSMLTRILVVMLAMVIFTVSVTGFRLVWLMIVEGEKYQSKAAEQQLYDTMITAPRGDIYDREGNVLATSAPAWNVYITPNGIIRIENDTKKEKVRAAIADGLSNILGEDRETIYNNTIKSLYYVTVKKQVDKEVADKVRQFIIDNSDLGLSSYIGLDETTKRYYPNDTLASVVLGFVGVDNQGLSGVESYYDTELTGIAGRVVAAKNAHGTDMPFTYEKVEEAKQGNFVGLTIDSYIQYVCEKYIAEAVDTNKVAQRGAVIAMNPKTGEILAMAIKGDFNPNDPFTLDEVNKQKLEGLEGDERTQMVSNLLNLQWRNKLVSDTY
ncbi:MAG: stage V sporulation protein D, partial [Clostridia bacterium]|nr:stage V sporulation protein D [Clostridia bacterium]